jgi:hypothetical protein
MKRKAQKSKSKEKKMKYSDDSYEELPGLLPEELRQLNRFQEEADVATDLYEELVDVQRSMEEEISNSLLSKNKKNSYVDNYKEYLDMKYRK